MVSAKKLGTRVGFREMPPRSTEARRPARAPSIDRHRGLPCRGQPRGDKPGKSPDGGSRQPTTLSAGLPAPDFRDTNRRKPTAVSFSNRPLAACLHGPSLCQPPAPARPPSSRRTQRRSSPPPFGGRRPDSVRPANRTAPAVRPRPHQRPHFECSTWAREAGVRAGWSQKSHVPAGEEGISHPPFLPFMSASVSRVDVCRGIKSQPGLGHPSQASTAPAATLLPRPASVPLRRPAAIASW